MSVKKIVLKHIGRSLVTKKALQPPSSVVIADKTIELPDAETQKRGFSLDSVEETLELARTFPTLFKQFILKGEK